MPLIFLLLPGYKKQGGKRPEVVPPTGRGVRIQKGDTHVSPYKSTHMFPTLALPTSGSRVSAITASLSLLRQAPRFVCIHGLHYTPAISFCQVFLRLYVFLRSELSDYFIFFPFGSAYLRIYSVPSMMRLAVLCTDTKGTSIAPSFSTISGLIVMTPLGWPIRTCLLP